MRGLHEAMESTLSPQLIEKLNAARAKGLMLDGSAGGVSGFYSLQVRDYFQGRAGVILRTRDFELYAQAVAYWMSLPAGQKEFSDKTRGAGVSEIRIVRKPRVPISRRRRLDDRMPWPDSYSHVSARDVFRRRSA